jgi:acetyl-CoA synthetase
VAAVVCDDHEPDRSAYTVVHPDLTATQLTYGDLRKASEQFAAGLAKHGVQPGDRVATLMGKGVDFLTALVGIWRLGAVHVPLFTAFAPPAIQMRLEASRAKVVICDDAQRGKLDGIGLDAQVVVSGTARQSDTAFDSLLVDAPFEAARLGGDAPIIHIFTSGTTGKPKGVVVPTRALASFHAYGEFGLNLRPTDLYWCAADPGWAYGLYFGVLASLLTGTPSLLLAANFSPESTLQVLASYPVTNLAAAPTIYRSLRASDLPIPDGLQLRCASSAGEPLTPEVNEWARTALGVEVHDHYGQTEAGMLINNHQHPALAHPLVVGSMGHAMPGWTGAVLYDDRDEVAPAGVVGRIAFDLANSPLAWFEGYQGDAEKSAEKFSPDHRWYLTGDAGALNEQGYFRFSARDDDVIIMAGYRIGPFDVESVLSTHEAIAECAVIAVPDAVRGEVIEAFAVVRNGYEPGEELEEELRQLVKRDYAAHAYPRKVHFVDALPKTPSGKVQRFVLRSQRREELGAGS